MNLKLCKILLFLILTFSNINIFAKEGSIEYISLTEASTQLGANLFWDPITNSGILEKNGNSVSFALNQEIVVYNFRDFAISSPPKMQDDVVFISKD